MLSWSYGTQTYDQGLYSFIADENLLYRHCSRGVEIIMTSFIRYDTLIQPCPSFMFIYVLHYSSTSKQKQKMIPETMVIVTSDALILDILMQQEVCKQKTLCLYLSQSETCSDSEFDALEAAISLNGS